MNESFWGTFIIATGVIIIGIIFFMQKVTNNNEQLAILLKETAQAAMNDAVDEESIMEKDSTALRINREAFVESFIRRFSQNASLANTYVVEIYDVNEYPPKISVRLKTREGRMIMNQEIEFDSINQIDAILEVPN